MNIIEKANEFENIKFSSKTTNDKILAAREAKFIILAINKLYKKNKNVELMDLMKRLTVIKQKIEKRIIGRPLNIA